VPQAAVTCASSSVRDLAYSVAQALELQVGAEVVVSEAMVVQTVVKMKKNALPQPPRHVPLFALVIRAQRVARPRLLVQQQARKLLSQH